MTLSAFIALLVLAIVVVSRLLPRNPFKSSRQERIRDVSRMALDGDGEDNEDPSLDAARERVDTTPVPWREGRRRLTLRDFRLLPKTDAERFVKKKSSWGLQRVRKRFLERGDTDRWFAPTLITRNRSIRDLAPDEAQLARLQLPEWKSEADVAAALAISVKQLRHFSIHRTRDRAPHYVCFAVPKRSGGERLIQAPKRRLKAVQRKLHELLVSRLPVSEQATGFRSGRSVVDNAAPHVGKQVVIKLDLVDFFPSINYRRVRGLLIAFGYSYVVAQTLAVLCTEAPRQIVEIDGARYHVPIGLRVLPQGAPTSPGLANAIATKLDHRLAEFARKRGFAYTRYADDLTFSGDTRNPAHIEGLIKVVGAIVADEGFSVHARKTRVMRRGAQQQVTGVTVNDSAGLSRQQRRKMRAQWHQLQQASSPDPIVLARARGMLAWLRMLNPAQLRGVLGRHQP